MARKKSREEQKAMFANLTGKKKVSIGLMKEIFEKKPKTFTIIPIGAGNPQSENFGLPMFTVNREEGLKLRKENMLTRQTESGFTTGFVGQIPADEFRRLAEKDPKARSLIKQKMKEKETKKESQKTQIGSDDPHEIPQTILDQLQASRVNGFPFFSFTGIKGFVLEGNDSLMLKQIPRNPNSISSVTVTYDAGNDLYNILFQKGKFPKNVPTKRVTGVFFDQLAEIITKEMGVL